jgi:hypothetical protein
LASKERPWPSASVLAQLPPRPAPSCTRSLSSAICPAVEDGPRRARQQAGRALTGDHRTAVVWPVPVRSGGASLPGVRIGMYVNGFNLYYGAKRYAAGNPGWASASGTPRTNFTHRGPYPALSNWLTLPARPPTGMKARVTCPYGTATSMYQPFL